MASDAKYPHRPWPVPAAPWFNFMRWHELLFMHWAVPESALRPLIPASLQLDTFDGKAWIGVVPFRMSHVRARLLPPIPGTSKFPELNVRTYVTAGGKPGVWFFSLDAANRLAVRGARWLFHLPYFDADMSCRRDADGWIEYESARVHRDAPAAQFIARYHPTGPVFHAAPGSLDHFLTERYCLYSADRNARVHRGDISHAPWPLRPAEARVSCNHMVEQIGLEAPRDPPILHYAERLDVVAWRIAAIE